VQHDGGTAHPEFRTVVGARLRHELLGTGGHRDAVVVVHVAGQHPLPVGQADILAAIDLQQR